MILFLAISQEIILNIIFLNISNISIFREFFGSGTLLGFALLPESYIGNGLMLLAPGAFIILGLIIWIQRTYTKYVEE